MSPGFSPWTIETSTVKERGPGFFKAQIKIDSFPARIQGLVDMNRPERSSFFILLFMKDGGFRKESLLPKSDKATFHLAHLCHDAVQPWMPPPQMSEVPGQERIHQLYRRIRQLQHHSD